MPSLFFLAQGKELAHDLICHRFMAILASLIVLNFFSVAKAQNSIEHQSGVVVVQFDSTTQITGKNNVTGIEAFDRLASEYVIYLIERVYPFLDHVQPTPVTRANLLALRRTYYVRYRTDIDPEIVSRSLSHISGVVYAEPLPVNRIHAFGRTEIIDPDDPEYGLQSELRRLHLPEVWDQVKSESGNPQVVIAIVDGGGEWRHEDLHANVWTNKNEIPDNGLDDDKNGFIDDIHGVDFLDDEDNDPTRQPVSLGNPWHGTAAAGIASAVSDNQIGIAGASWNALLMHINASHPIGIGVDIKYGYEGILYAAMNGADIINTSWGGIVLEDMLTRFLDQSLNLATDMGSLIIASAGNLDANNDYLHSYPAYHPRVLSVGATEKETRRRADFSNYGKLIDVFAPGESIWSTGIDNTYIRVTGTSFAAPLVAGLAALVKTKFPDMTPDALREKIRHSAESMDLENPGFHGKLGRGFVNGLAAVLETDIPAIRLKQWSWTDDGDQIISPGDGVTVKGVFINHLADAEQFMVGLVEDEPYSFLEIQRNEVAVDFLASGDSIEVTFEFRVDMDAPTNQQVRFYMYVQAGGIVDMADMLSFRVNRSIEAVHQGLNTLYTATGGDQWLNRNNWNFTVVPNEEELDQWYGVTMREGWLYGLDLSLNNLTQSIPSELGGLSELQSLNLSENLLSGPIPSELSRLSGLRRLNLAGNALSGPIPSVLGDLHKLEHLDLFENNLSGPIPVSIGDLSLLKTLNLEANSLSGLIPDLWDLARLEFLGLRENSLSGPIPIKLSNLSSLVIVDLGENDLSGSIPSELGNLPNLKWLILRENSLSGIIPTELGNLQQLDFLDLSHNFLTGSIPIELTNIFRLEQLDLEENSLSGTVPPELGNLSRLTRLILSNNTLTGSLPRNLIQLKNLVVFHFDGQDLCAPNDIEFQRWLQGIPDVMGSTCDALGFAENIEDQDYPRAQPIPSLILPAATQGSIPIQYSLTPALPAGLNFNSSTRTISGTPTVITGAPIEYTYTATDVTGKSGVLIFRISIYSPVSTEEEALPEEFVVTGNYPNPFRKVTRLIFDLPIKARLSVKVADITGRHVLAIPEHDIDAGWSKSIEVNGESLPAGLYLYSLIANSSSGSFIQTGRFVRIH